MKADEPPKMPMRIRPPGERRSLSRSATRALDVLELFGDQRRPLRAIEVARALEMSASSTNQMLKTMVDSAHLMFDAVTKAYVPSLRLARFASWMALTHGAERRIHAMMRELELLSGETVTLATTDDLFMLILDRTGPTGGALTPERGFRVSIFGSALGAAYLSTLSAPDMRRLSKRARVKDADMPAIVERVRRVRVEGVAEEGSPGGDAWSLAAPLPQGGHIAPLVLGLVGPVARMQPRIAELRAMIRGVLTRHQLELLGGGNEGD